MRTLRDALRANGEFDRMKKKLDAEMDRLKSTFYCERCLAMFEEECVCNEAETA